METNQITEINKLQQLLKYVFVVVPIVAGADKFFNLLADWSQYLASGTRNLLPFEPDTFMMLVGIVEIVAGIIVLVKTRLGGYIISVWLLLIALSLLFTWHHVDVAVRDVVIAIAAFVLARLTMLTSGKN